MDYLVSKVTVPDWAAVPAVELTHTGWLPITPVSATAQLCHDGKNLYVHMEAVESDVRAVLADPLDQVCEDSCLEFFLAPMAGDTRYFNFEFNPLGNFYMAFGRLRETRCRLLPADRDQFAIKPYYTENGWGITYQIPASFIQMFMPEFKLSGEASCNFYKCGEKTDMPHYLAWAKLTCEDPDYHRVQDFDKLIFE